MRIQLENRQHWLFVIEHGLKRIEEIREKSDEQFLEIWRKRKWLPDRKPNEFPEYGASYFDWSIGYLEYPSSVRWKTKYHLENIQRALLMDNTGELWVDSEELAALRWAEEGN